MKQFVTLLTFLMVSFGTYAASDIHWSERLKAEPEVKSLPVDLSNMGLEEFLTLTPKKYKEITGEKMGVKKAIQLKVAQKIVKSKLNKDAAADISKGVYILLAIIGLGWLAMGLLDDWSGSDWIIALVLSFLCWIPGVIYSLIKMKNYYS